MANLFLGFTALFFITALLNADIWEDARYKQFQAKFEESVKQQFPNGGGPRRASRHDAPGEQRWSFPTTMLFDGSSLDLSARGQRSLRAFANVLRDTTQLWWRIRVEAHTRQPSRRPNHADERRAMELTASRAVAVAMYLYLHCHIEPFRIVPSGRGYQDLIRTDMPTSAQNDRVDILVLPRTVGAGKRT
ncbi:MAG: OmpA/MotB family protein [Chthonomonadales bacterium]